MEISPDLSYSRSPACTSKETAEMKKINPDFGKGPILQIHAGPDTYDVNNDVCCGHCHIRFPQAQVYYWPTKGNNNT